MKLYHSGIFWSVQNYLAHTSTVPGSERVRVSVMEISIFDPAEFWVVQLSQLLQLLSSYFSHSLHYCYTYSSHFLLFDACQLLPSHVCPASVCFVPGKWHHGQRPNSLSCIQKKKNSRQNNQTEIKKNFNISGNSLSVSVCLSRNRDGEQSASTKSLQWEKMSCLPRTHTHTHSEPFKARLWSLV